MTYQTGQLIQATDYNNFVWGNPSGTNTVVTSNANLNYLWGPGYGDRGMNQPMTGLIAGLPGSMLIVDNEGVFHNDKIGTLDPVEGNSTDAGIDLYSGDPILAQQWIGFFSSLNCMRYFQSGSQGNVALTPVPGYGRVIKAHTGVAEATTGALAQANTWFNTAVPSTGVQYSETQREDGATFSIASTAQRVTVSSMITVTWATGNDARWFFNSGGQVIINISGRGAGFASASPRTLSAIQLLRKFGTAIILGKTSQGFTGNDGSGATGGIGKGYWSMTPEQNYTLGYVTLGSGTYSDSFARVDVKMSDASGIGGQSGANGRTLKIYTTLESGFGDTGVLPAWATDSLSFDTVYNIAIINSTGAGSVIQKRWNDPIITSPVTL